MNDFDRNAKMSHDIWEYRAADEIEMILQDYLGVNIVRGRYGSKEEDINQKVDYVFSTGTSDIPLQFRFRRRTLAEGYEDFNNELKIRTFSYNSSGDLRESEFFKTSYDFFVYGVVNSTSSEHYGKRVDDLVVIDMKKFRKYSRYIAISSTGNFYKSYVNKDGVENKYHLTYYYPEDRFNDGNRTLRLPISVKHTYGDMSIEKLFKDCIVYKRGF